MKAKITNIYSKNRIPLNQVVPLDTPFTIILEPTTYCDLKCKFCLHSMSKQNIIDSGHVFEMMSDETFNRILEQVSEFPQKIKSVNIAGLGEPLLHSKLPQMISKLKSTGRVEQISIITNGVPLTHSLSQDLVDAGTDSIKISLNGLNAQDYQENCGMSVNFDKYCAEIAYLYENKKNLQVNIKILDVCLGDAEESVFYEKFGNYCDRISVEKTVKLYEELSYDNIIVNNSPLSRFDLKRQERVKICPSPFFRISVRSTGSIMVCCPYNGLKLDEATVHNTTLLECWNGDMHRSILKNILEEKWEGITEKCRKCVLKDDFAFSEDILDDHIQEISQRLGFN